MVNTPSEKLNLLSWLQEHESFSSLKKQKFLFFYEMFQKISNKEYDLYSLKAYVNGPVFSNVYGDFVHNEIDMNSAIKVADSSKVDEDNASRSYFLISTMTEKELSELTHSFDLWSRKKELVVDENIKQVSIIENDISEEDISGLNDIYSSLDIVNYDYQIVAMQDKFFVFLQDDYNKLNEKHYHTLEKLSNIEELVNPVYVSVDVDGALLVD